MSGAAVRAIAALAVFQVSQQKRSLEAALEKAMTATKSELDERDTGLLKELISGSLRWYFRLEWVAAQLFDKPLKKKDSDILSLIIVGLYQLEFTRVPAHAAVGETVSATRIIGKPWAKALINALLRRYQRENKSLVDMVPPAHTQFAFPHWMFEKIKTQRPQQWQIILRALNQRPPFTLRVNQARTTRAQYCVILDNHDVSFALTPDSPVGITLDQPLPVQAVLKFGQGLVGVQDESAQLAVHSLLSDVVSGEELRVLDACAAPGGKTCHLLELCDALQAVTELVAVDLAERIAKIWDNFSRLGLSATVVGCDVRDVGKWWDGRLFNRILLDAPCTGTGVIGRHPDIKHLRRDADIANAAELQFSLLLAMWPLLAPGGRLLYTTCSILAEENEGVVTRFLSDCQSAVEIPLPKIMGERVSVGSQRLPGIHSGDGFFYALLEHN